MNEIVDEGAIINVALVDGHCLLCDLLSARLREQPGFRVAWATHSPTEAQGLLERDPPDVLLVDTESRMRDSFQLIAMAAAARADVRVIILTNNDCDALVSLSSNASGYFLKDESFEKLLVGIRQVAAGAVYYSERIARRLRLDSMPDAEQAAGEPHCLRKLTPHQLQLLRHLALGESSKDIAKHMHLSVKSVDSNKYRLMCRLGVHNRVQLARLAIRAGLVSP